MKFYLVKYPGTTPTLVSENLEIPEFSVEKSYSVRSLSLEKEELLKNDVILFYKEFELSDGSTQDMIFAYFQIGKILKNEIFPSKTLSFDQSRFGSGALGYSRKRVLSRYNSPSSHWSLPEFFRGVYISCNKKDLSSSFHDEGSVRYFENKTSHITLTSPHSRESGVYYENALLEFVSSMLENIRKDATRRFCETKKGDIGKGKTGFVKYLYSPDRRKKVYCRTCHTLGKKRLSDCRRCSLYKNGNCEWSLPLYGASPYVPTSDRDAFAYFDVLLEKGLVMDYRDE